MVQRAALCLALSLLGHAEGWEGRTGGWLTGDGSLAGPCTVERRQYSSLSSDEFRHEYVAAARPLVITGLPPSAFAERTEREALLRELGDTRVVLSSANTFSYSKRSATLRAYVDGLQPQTLDENGNSSFLLFGDHDRSSDGGGWASFLDVYERSVRPLFASRSRGDLVTLSFGIAAGGTGVPFHVHGPAMSETVWGRKRWLLSPPKHKPDFDGDQSTLQWVTRRMMADDGQLLECTVGTNEALYVPEDWWHATLNVGEAVFVSAFTNWATEELR